MLSSKGTVLKTPAARAAATNKRTKQLMSGASSSKSHSNCNLIALIAYALLASCVSLFVYVAGSSVFSGVNITPDHVLGLVSHNSHPIITSGTSITGNIIVNGNGGNGPIPSHSVTSLPPTVETNKRNDYHDGGKKGNNNNNNNKSNRNNNKGKKVDMTLLKYHDYGPEPHIAFIHGEKDGTIKQDMRVLLPDIEVTKLVRHEREQPSNIVGAPHAFVRTQTRLKALPLLEYLSSSTPYPTLETTMSYIHQLPQCKGKPVFLSMASVGDDLYWQLIENFVYTMVKFDTVECALVICVSDANCMRLCDKLHFPCFDFQSNIVPKPSVMEQIGEVKLFHVPKALEQGVDVFMLDLDVGFLNDPMVMVRAFDATPNIDIFVQEDLIFIMNRTKAGWKTWFTQPLPNIGLFLCRGNEKTARMFSIAWKKYQNMEDKLSKMNPGKDQNHVLDAMRFGRANFGLRYAYFSNSSAVLLDKLVLSVDRSVELGGEAADNLLSSEHTIAAHTTCYEHTTKVLGLKATNAFWNPVYYDPIRPTLTKQIMYVSEYQVLDEVRTLLWLGMVTGRAVIIPNLLGNTDHAGAHRYHGQAMWPGFRVSKIKRDKGIAAIKTDILEPAFYWRVQRDYDDVPEPVVVTIPPGATALDIKSLILANGNAAPRIVLHISRGRRSNAAEDEQRMVKWAKDSVGEYERPYAEELRRYSQLPSVKSLDRSVEYVNTVLGGLRNCDDIFTPHKGNRSCFQICE